MTMTDDKRDVHSPTDARIPGYAENPPQVPSAAPHPDSGGDISQVGVVRDSKEPCPECQKLITRKNMKTHLRNVHGVRERRPYKRKAADEQPKKTRAPRQPKITVDEIVLVVVQMRWPNGVPVDKVQGLFEWKQHTERFLNE